MVGTDAIFAGSVRRPRTRCEYWPTLERNEVGSEFMLLFEPLLQYGITSSLYRNLVPVGNGLNLKIVIFIRLPVMKQSSPPTTSFIHAPTPLVMASHYPYRAWSATTQSTRIGHLWVVQSPVAHPAVRMVVSIRVE